MRWLDVQLVYTTTLENDMSIMKTGIFLGIDGIHFSAETNKTLGMAVAEEVKKVMSE